MKFIEHEMLFEGTKRDEKKPRLLSLNKSTDSSTPRSADEILGIKIRLGNEPIVNNLRKILELRGGTMDPKLELALGDKDIYSIVHAVGVLRIKGKAKVEQLRYEAEVVDLPGAQTRDLMPNTSFRDVLNVNANLEGGLTANGSFAAEIPQELSKVLIPNEYFSLGGDVKLNLASTTTFVGKISFSLKLPITQASGASSNRCGWVLNPDKNPLLGDQLLVQTIAVPKGTTQIKYKMFGEITADKGFLWKKEELKTQVHEVVVQLQ